MNFAAAEAIAKTVLYEGYVLYPYRPSAIKNRQRWTFGGVYPRGESSAAEGGAPLRCECVVEGDSSTRIEIRLRFLHLVTRQVFALGSDGSSFVAVESIGVNGRTYCTWDEAVEREIRIEPVALTELLARAVSCNFAFAASAVTEDLRDASGIVSGRIVRTQQAIRGRVTASAAELRSGVCRARIDVENDTPANAPSAHDQQALALLSAHVLAGVEGGTFASLIDPPAHLIPAALGCENDGAWPVLVGEDGTCDTLLFSPIILYDWPRVAEASPGDLFGGNEIDEILTCCSIRSSVAVRKERCTWGRAGA